MADQPTDALAGSQGSYTNWLFQLLSPIGYVPYLCQEGTSGLEDVGLDVVEVLGDLVVQLNHASTPGLPYFLM